MQINPSELLQIIEECKNRKEISQPLDPSAAGLAQEMTNVLAQPNKELEKMR
jgi:hypothetical protein